MKENEFEKKLESMSTPAVTELSHSNYTKMAILSAKKSSRLTFWLLLVPALVLITGFLQSVSKVQVPPWSWIQQYSPAWPSWIRFGVYFLILIAIPSLVVILNLLSILWIHFDRKERVLHISIRFRTFNIIIILAAGILALLFLAHSLGEYFRSQ